MEQGMEQSPYTEVTLDKVKPTHAQAEKEHIEGYQELFENRNDSKTHQDVQFKRILLKSDPRLGKSSMAKKIAHDWVMGFFTSFTLVFFFSLNLVRAGETIENILIQQTPELDALNVTQQRLRKILDHHRNRVLLILDGLDQHALGSNDDIWKIITGQTLQQCNILLTSRPHNTRDIEQYFSTTAKILGFTKSQARMYAMSIFKDNSKVEAMLNLTPSPTKSSDDWYYSPQLLTFLCSLVKDGLIDLCSKSMNIGDICTRMVRQLYKIFSFRKGIPHEEREFIAMLQKVGWVAWTTLPDTGCDWSRSRVLSHVGGDTFNYGLFTGHEGQEFPHYETDMIEIQFLNGTIQKYLAAFYFIQTLSDNEKKLDYASRRPELMENRTFLYLCLWFLNPSKSHFLLRKSSRRTI